MSRRARIRRSSSGYYTNQASGDKYSGADWLMDTDYFEEEDQEDFFGFDIEDEKCSHEWVEYNGFIENYEYCKKCDLKKEDDE